MSDVDTWLEEIGFSEYADLFAKNDIHMSVLPELGNEDLRELGLSLGHRKLLLRAIRERFAEPDLATDEQQLQGDSEADEPPLDSAGPERRHLTVLFSDIVGSVDISVRLDPDDLHEVIQSYQQCVEEAVAPHGGYIARYVGDGVMIYFGYPVAQEREAEQAVRAGLEIVRRVSGLKVSEDISLQVRVAAASGLVVVGDRAGRSSVEEQAVGQTPNLAARLQGLTEPNSLVISDSTRMLVEGLFELENLGEHQFKGFGELHRAWRVVAARDVSSAFDATHADGDLTPLAGRGEELELLSRRWKRARLGEGQIVLLSGEPGIGKSRMVRELQERLRDEPHAAIACYCTEQHRNSALYPVIRQLVRVIGASSSAPEARKLESMESLLDSVDVDRSKAIPLLASLLNLPADQRYPPPSMSAELRRSRLLEILERIVISIARSGRALLVVVEDLQWIDPTTLELVDRLLERTRSLPLLMVLTFRPEFSEHWTGDPIVTKLTLSRLEAAASAALVESMAGANLLSAEVVTRIVAKTDGVPLFLEELTKTILTAGFIREDDDRKGRFVRPLPLEIPDTLHDSLMARLDRLAPVKEVAQIGAVIGRQFRFDLLSRISRLSEAALRDALAKLAEAEIVRVRGVPPSATYTFTHSLVKDSAYNSLVRPRRQELHARIAEAYLEHFPDHSESHPELVAHHAAEGGLGEQAIECWLSAARRALDRSANLEAIAYLDSGIETLSMVVAETVRARQELDLQLLLGRGLTATKGFAASEVKAAYSRARALTELGAEPARKIGALIGLWNFHMVRAEHDTARDLAEQRFELAREMEEPAWRPGAFQNMAVVRFNFGEFRVSLDLVEEGLRLHEHLASRAQVLGSYDVGFGCRCYAGWAKWMLGFVDGAAKDMTEVLRIAREQSQPFARAFSLFMAACFHQFRREPTTVLRYSQALLELSEEQHFEYRVAQAQVLRGWALSALEDPRDAVEQILEGIRAWRETGARVMEPFLLGLLADAHGRNHQFETAIEVLDQALELARHRNERFYLAELHRLKGMLLVGAGWPAGFARQSGPGADWEAEKCFRQAVEVAQTQGARFFELRATENWARVLDRRGAGEEGQTMLRRVLDEITEGLDAADVREARETLLALGKRTGERTKG